MFILSTFFIILKLKAKPNLFNSNPKTSTHLPT